MGFGPLVWFDLELVEYNISIFEKLGDFSY